MKVLVIGGGGREHAIAWAAARSSSVTEVHVAPGNPGTALLDKTRNIELGVSDHQALLQHARDHQIDLTIVGPEQPLVDGIAGLFENAGLALFGPSRTAAQLEGSKAFTKQFLKKYQIPTADYQEFSAIDLAESYIRKRGAPIVIKADGLAAGKGVVVAQTVEDALAAARDMLSGNRFGDAGHRIVVEDCLIGEEASFICIVDGTTALPMASSQDHKARDNGDLGPNTGGMGAYSPAPVVTPAIHEHIMQDIIEPTVAGMKAEGNPFVGFLYAGLMIDEDGRARVIEFNVRLGDPEAQVLLMRLESSLPELCLDAINGRLAGKQTDWNPQTAVGVVMAAGGYPDSYNKGDIINGLNNSVSEKTVVFHAGTQQTADGIATNGGRVLCVTATGDTVTEAQKLAYRQVEEISWDKAFYRTDIGYRAIARENY